MPPPIESHYNCTKANYETIKKNAIIMYILMWRKNKNIHIKWQKQVKILCK